MKIEGFEKGRKMIPKTIHYCWFGGNKKPKLVEKCIQTWRKYLPDWEIREWNDANYDYKRSSYAEAAYDAGKYAFVSDYARFDILKQYGGVYLDTDVEMVRPIPEEFLQYGIFCALEMDAMIAPGLVFAGVKEHSLFDEILYSYSIDKFERNEKGLYLSVVTRCTALLEEKGFKREDRFQRLEDIAIFPEKYFCAYDMALCKPVISQETIAFHHYAASWLPWYLRARKRLGARVRRVFNNGKGI